jgi:hypothetical protein
MKHRCTTLRTAQRGAASLVVAMILLFGMTMVAFYANRGLLFEQKTSANQYRATSAFEVAEAGIEWATARLNEPQKINTACAASAVTSDRTFRDKYLRHTTAANGFNPVPSGGSGIRPGCRLPASGTPVCSCPDAGSPSLGTVSEPRFTVSFAPGADPESVVLTAIGCTAGTQCVPEDPLASADATAQVRVVVKLLPTLRSNPLAALTAGGDVTLGGTTDNIGNNDPLTNYMTVNAETLRVTWPGAPVIASTTPDPPENAVFRAHFGQDLLDYKGNAATAVICDAAVYGAICPASTVTCTGGPGCATTLVNEIAKGRSQFWIDAEPEFTDANVPVEVGKVNNPVLLVSPYRFTFSGTRPLHGVLVGAGQTFDIRGAGTTEVRGAIIARNDFDSTSNFTLSYRADVLQKLRPAAGAMVRVPGSWSDM